MLGIFLTIKNLSFFAKCIHPGAKPYSTVEGENFFSFTKKYTFKICCEVENGSSPLIDEFACLFFVLFRLFRMFVKVHDSFPDSR